VTERFLEADLVSPREPYLKKVGPHMKSWFRNDSDFDLSEVIHAMRNCWSWSTRARLFIQVLRRLDELLHSDAWTKRHLVTR